ncbi:MULTISPECIES: bifunctional tetrahydrofolate synthase/dihydrofolate synthase [unclassified Undibacterium]|uniref:bifunctional tetrahydrofolate synthase/dihydrofolate synthase n=1 Tax=unclassified Undibacterium TaxID=2630295 RepID=UPI002AC9A0DD|nr:MULTISPECIES: bifunctional tetrahydrofolate synthase/dihydrofolate synthase [unclassified Undibacterium]MEB0138459.1 bifunctional tetrahydrofolate synthase/dihydrofolate synthase [Undibacterium sp. CCC2.1]MEB0173140.1 bifunctional tetrahydrofolate synthase/dihydrofolate synthase [Undibacterium sp. CCC1.1]MEB0177531.1 bifunctional tetrahydrofolate synthase/dihydrofolate synthase [Undibacterium sp. CCC3.4]MEB0216153.1 bifunctional tetrahydrofolate synthase/dihydrofolate synthase [Undibacterium
MPNLPDSLPTWLALLETRHAKEIDMGLDRVAAVKQSLDIRFAVPVIMVAGTNGKGSTCAMLEAILLEAGYRVGLYSKPHFLDFNERARINGTPVQDQLFIDSFAAVEAARGSISLTYFEFTTLAICKLLADAPLDVVILEVGLGGRLDAVNVFDADVAIVTSVDIDHVDYLGDTREKIGFEKAGIFRAGKPAICSDPQPPQSLIDHAQAIGADLRLFGRDFNYNGDKQQWNFAGRDQRRNSLGYPSLRGANQLLNASAVLAALEALRHVLPVGAQEVRTGLVMVDLPGRFQVMPGRPTVVLDVAHNPHAAATLSQNLDNMGFHAYTYAVFGSMLDKDVAGVIAQLKQKIDHWHVCDLPLPRAASAGALKQLLLAADVLDDAEKSITEFSSPENAYADALSKAGENDRIVVFGSFLTVAGVMRARRAALH